MRYFPYVYSENLYESLTGIRRGGNQIEPLILTYYKFIEEDMGMTGNYLCNPFNSVIINKKEVLYDG